MWLMIVVFQVDLVQAQMKSKGGYAHGGSEGSQL